MAEAPRENVERVEDDGTVGRGGLEAAMEVGRGGLEQKQG